MEGVPSRCPVRFLKQGRHANAGREGTPVFTVVAQEGSEKSAAEASGSLLDELVRDGARQMLAAALQAEVAAYVEQFADVLVSCAGDSLQ